MQGRTEPSRPTCIACVLPEVVDSDLHFSDSMPSVLCFVGRGEAGGKERGTEKFRMEDSGSGREARGEARVVWLGGDRVGRISGSRAAV